MRDRLGPRNQRSEEGDKGLCVYDKDLRVTYLLTVLVLSSGVILRSNGRVLQHSLPREFTVEASNTLLDCLSDE